MDIETALRQTDLFAALNDEQLTALSEIVAEYQVIQGEIISRQADIGEHLYLMLEGEATAHRIDEQGFRKPVASFQPGDGYGATALFLDAPRDATVTMTTDGRVGVISRDSLEELLDERPDIDHELLLDEDLVDRLEAPEYDWLAEGEIVLFAGHRHWLVLISKLFRNLLYLGLYAIVSLGINRLIPSISYIKVLFPGLIIYGLVALFKWIDWQDDVLIATTRRISHRERVALLYETLREAPIDRIQNINVSRAFPGSLFGFGDITFATAAEVGELRFTGLPQPEIMREKVFEQLETLRASRKASQRDTIRQELSGRLTRADESDTVNQPIDPPPTSGLPSECPADTSPFTDDDVTTDLTNPGRLTKALNWLAKKGWVPRTRFEENGSITWRKHWLFLFGGMLRPLLLTATLIALAVLARRGIPGILVALIPEYAALLAILAIASLAWFWWTANDWANDLYTITRDRVIDVERRPLSFSIERREASLGMIQNVSLSVNSILAAAFNYGDVIIQTAGAGDFTFHHVSNPRHVQQEIFNHLEAFREKKRQQEASLRRAELAEWLTVYDQMKHGQPDASSDGEPITET